MIEDKIYEYLKEYADSMPGVCTDPSLDTTSYLREYPEESFYVIANYSGKFPENLDPRDLGDPLGRLLSNIADLVPDLLVPRMTSGFWASRYLFICSAAASKFGVFVPIIISLLNDRSIYIKSLVLGLIVQWPHLQVTEALPILNRLSGLKSFQIGEGKSINY